MASILITTNKGKGTSLALRLAHEGHIVKMYADKPITEGFMQGMKNPSVIASLKLLDQFDLVLDDGTGNPSVDYDIQESGRPVIGGGPFPSKLMNIDYVNKIKTVLCLPSIEPSLEGIKVFTYAWFDGNRFDYTTHAIVTNKFLDNNRGPSTECSGVVLTRGESDKLSTIALNPFEDLLRKVEYIGPFGVETLLHGEKSFYGSIKAGFIYDVFPTSFELIKGSLFDFLWKFFLKEERLPISNEYALSVRLSVPPYPYNQGKDENYNPYISVPEPAKPHVWLDGHDSIIGCITARGATINEARRRVYRTIRNTVQSDIVQFRQDIGQIEDEQIKQLREWGWLE